MHRCHCSQVPVRVAHLKLLGLGLCKRRPWNGSSSPVSPIDSTHPHGSSAARRHAVNKQQHPTIGSDNPLALAFLGDAIWTLHIRCHFLQPPKHPQLYQAAVRPYVTAEGQAAVFDRLMQSARGPNSLLQPEEVEFLRAVRAWESVKLRQRFASSAAAADVYRKATALEALVGHLHLHNPQRLTALVTALLPPAEAGTAAAAAGTTAAAAAAAAAAGTTAAASPALAAEEQEAQTAEDTPGG